MITNSSRRVPQRHRYCFFLSPQLRISWLVSVVAHPNFQTPFDFQSSQELQGLQSPWLEASLLSRFDFFGRRTRSSVGVPWWHFMCKHRQSGICISGAPNWSYVKVTGRSYLALAIPGVFDTKLTYSQVFFRQLLRLFDFLIRLEF